MVLIGIVVKCIFGEQFDDSCIIVSMLLLHVHPHSIMFSSISINLVIFALQFVDRLIYLVAKQQTKLLAPDISISWIGFGVLYFRWTVVGKANNIVIKSYQCATVTTVATALTPKNFISTETFLCKANFIISPKKKKEKKLKKDENK